MVTPEMQRLVLSAFAILTVSAPSHAGLHCSPAIHPGTGSSSLHPHHTLDLAFAGHSDKQLAARLLKSTELNGIDLEGDGNTDNVKLAIDFIRTHLGHCVKAMLDLVEQLSNITSGPLLNIACAYNNKIQMGYAHANDPSSDKAARTTMSTM